MDIKQQHCRNGVINFGSVLLVDCDYPIELDEPDEDGVVRQRIMISESWLKADEHGSIAEAVWFPKPVC